MAEKQQLRTHDSLLNAVARKLGRAAGAVTKVTHELTENVLTLPEGAMAKVSNADNVDASSEQPRVKMLSSKRRPHRALRARQDNGKTKAEKRSPTKNKAPRGNQKPAKAKTKTTKR